MPEQNFHIHLIREQLSKRQKANPSYSLRAFARDLGMDPSTLSAILKGKRAFPVKSCEQISQALNLSPMEKQYFFESAFKKRILLDQIKINPLSLLPLFPQIPIM